MPIISSTIEKASPTFTQNQYGANVGGPIKRGKLFFFTDWEGAFERVARAAKTNGIHWAILPPNLAYARRCVDMGCRMLALGMDIGVVQRGLKAFKTEYAEMFGAT